MKLENFGDPFIPTPLSLIRAKLELAEITPDDVVYDLGCGDGRVLIEAATRYGARGVGVEIQESVAELAWGAVIDHGVESQVEIRCENYMKTDLTGAGLVVLYLTTRTLHSLSEKLKELPSGARLVTHDFALPGWDLSEQGRWEAPDGTATPLYLYRKA